MHLNYRQHAFAQLRVNGQQRVQPAGCLTDQFRYYCCGKTLRCQETSPHMPIIALQQSPQTTLGADDQDTDVGH